jgi:hypothetical protein
MNYRVDTNIFLEILLHQLTQFRVELRCGHERCLAKKS